MRSLLAARIAEDLENAAPPDRPTVPDVELGPRCGIYIGEIVVEAKLRYQAASRLAILKHLFDKRSETLIGFATKAGEAIRHAAMTLSHWSPEPAVLFRLKLRLNQNTMSDSHYQPPMPGT